MLKILFTIIAASSNAVTWHKGEIQIRDTSPHFAHDGCTCGNVYSADSPASCLSHLKANKTFDTAMYGTCGARACSCYLLKCGTLERVNRFHVDLHLFGVNLYATLLEAVSDAVNAS